MKKTILIFAVLMLAVLLLMLCSRKIQENKEVISVETTENSTEETGKVSTTPVEKMPESILYYGEIKEILREDQKPVSLKMESPRDGEWVMHVGETTAFVDAGQRISFARDQLQEGDRVYVFRSPMATRSLPPQSPALAVVKNIPMDAGCPMYHRIEKLEDSQEILQITSDGGETILGADQDTTLLSPEGEKLPLSSLQEGDVVMAWYWDRGEEILHPSHLMLLPDPEKE